ncbi:MAG: cell wall-binding repeat-containing protein, partial [Euzebya sp.]
AELTQRCGGVVWLSGANRAATAAAAPQQVVAQTGTRTVMIARAGPDDVAPWADALAGGAYGAYAGIPVMLSDSDRLSPETASAIAAMGITRTLVLGGKAAISNATMAALPSPTRLDGEDRTATAVAVARILWDPTASVSGVVLVNGYDSTAWAYALVAAPLSARRHAPLLITTPTMLPANPRSYLEGTPGLSGGVIAGPARLVDPEVGYAASNLLR